MAINYQLRKQKFNVAGKQKELIIASTINKGVATLEELETMVSKISSASEGDVRSILRTLSDLICQNLSQGRIVDLGDIGRIRVIVKSKSADKIENFKTDNIKGLKAIFSVGKRIRKAMQTARIEHKVIKDTESELNEVSLPQP